MEVEEEEEEEAVKSACFKQRRSDSDVTHISKVKKKKGYPSSSVSHWIKPDKTNLENLR